MRFTCWALSPCGALLSMGMLMNGLAANEPNSVVSGASYQFIGELGTGELDNILNVESKTFLAASNPPASYVLPGFPQARYAVKLYKFTYNSIIPERANRPTTATGLVAIPVPNATEAVAPGPITRPLVSYQHGTVYGLHQVPSYAFSLDRNSPDYLGAYETRLAVAQFGGQGYVVIAADYFGMGDSIEPDAYGVKGSEQQACLDMLRESTGLIRAQNVNVSHLLLYGWSQGGLVTMAFLEKLEELGIKVTAAATAAAPSDVLGATTAYLFNRRDSSSPTPDGNWINTIFIIAAFSYEEYHSKPGLAFNLFSPEYFNACQKIYNRKYDHMAFDRSNGDILVYSTATDPAPLQIPADLTKLIRPQYFDENAVSDSGPRYYPFSEFAKLLHGASAYQWAIKTPVQVNFGTHDEAFAPEVVLIPYHYQKAINKKNPIEVVPVAGGNHRGTFLTGVVNALDWFNVLLVKRITDRPSR